jgi:phage recombination protein Bet
MNAVISQVQPKSVLVRMAHNFGIEPEKMLGTLKATAFKGDVSNEQMMALLVVAEQYNLNPWTKEIYAFPDRNHGIVPVVGVDGWSRIINSHPQFDGMDFEDGPLNERKIPEWIECVMHRKDRSHPVKVKEYFAEVARDVGPWKSHPRRMLRHQTKIQAIDVTPTTVDPRGDLTAVNYELRDKHVNAITDIISELGGDEAKLGPALQDYTDTHLKNFHELYITVQDKLVSDGIMKRAYWRSLVK